MGFINVNDELERRESQVPWQTSGNFRFRAFIEKDNLFAAAAVRRLNREKLDGLSIVSKAAVSQWRINAKLALELNERGVHARIGNACCCGLRLEVERTRGKQAVSRIEFEKLLFSLPGHLDTKTLALCDLDIVRGFIDWPQRSFWIQPAGELVDTRWHCLICGDFAPARAGDDGQFKWNAHVLNAKHQKALAKGRIPTVWSEDQLKQLAKWRAKQTGN
jgi:hypothetical protein